MNSAVARLAHPEWLAPLAAALVLVVVSVAGAQLLARRRRRLLLGSAARPATGHFASDAALVLALAAVVVALLGPRVGERLVDVPASGVDVVLLFDVSRSMDAVDTPPSRIDRARRGAEELLARLSPFDRAALAAYAGDGVLLTPLTPDRHALTEFLSGIDTELIRPGGSDLGAGVRAALDAFEAGSERPRVVLVLGDGEDPERSDDLGAAEAARDEVRVVAVALGTERGATVPDHGVDLLDRFGSVVVSRRARDRLAALTLATDGMLFAGDEWGGFDFDGVAASIRRDAGAVPGARVTRRVRAVRVAPFAALAFALLGLEGLRRPGRLGRRRLPRRANAVPSVAAVALLAIVAAPAPAGEAEPTAPSTIEALEAALRAKPEDPGLLVELGAARLERGKRAAASRAFLAAAVAARDPKAAAVAYYDLGVAALEDGDLEAARDAFYDALALAPGDTAARFNLEWTLLALERRPTPEPEPEADREGPAADAPPDPMEPPRSAPESQIPEAAPEQPALSEAQQQRWFDRVEDDPGTSLRGAVDAQIDPDRRRAGAPAW